MIHFFTSIKSDFLLEITREDKGIIWNDWPHLFLTGLDPLKFLIL